MRREFPLGLWGRSYPPFISLLALAEIQTGVSLYNLSPCLAMGKWYPARKPFRTATECTFFPFMA